MSLSTKGEASHSIHLHVHVHSGLSQLYYIAGLHVGTVSYPGQKGCDSKCPLPPHTMFMIRYYPFCLKNVKFFNID